MHGPARRFCPSAPSKSTRDNHALVALHASQKSKNAVACGTAFSPLLFRQSLRTPCDPPYPLRTPPENHFAVAADNVFPHPYGPPRASLLFVTCGVFPTDVVRSPRQLLHRRSIPHASRAYIAFTHRSDHRCIPVPYFWGLPHRLPLALRLLPQHVDAACTPRKNLQWRRFPSSIVLQAARGCGHYRCSEQSKPDAPSRSRHIRTLRNPRKRSFLQLLATRERPAS